MRRKSKIKLHHPAIMHVDVERNTRDQLNKIAEEAGISLNDYCNIVLTDSAKSLNLAVKKAIAKHELQTIEFEMADLENRKKQLMRDIK